MPALWPLALLAFAPPQQPATQHCTVRGVVLDGEQRPLGNVAMAVVEDDGRDLAQALAAAAARSAADGSFALALDVRRDPEPWLVIAAPRFATVMVRLSAGELDLGTIAMAPGGIGAGRVRDDHGAPVAGASVVIGDLLDTRTFLANQRGDVRARCRTTAVTDGSGIFRAPGMVQSAGVLRVGKDGFGDAVLQPIAIGDPLEVTLVPATQDLSAQLRILLESGRRSAGDFADGPMSTRTDGDGNYELRCLAPGSNAVLVHVPARAAVTPSTLFLRPAAVREGVDFTVADFVTLTGRFDAPLPAGTRSRVRWMSSRGPPEPSDDSGGLSIGADRSFTVALKPGQYELYVLPPVPPRGGRPLPVRSGQWQHQATAEGVVKFTAPALASMKGKVDGPVPWSRLAVGAMTSDQTRRYSGFSVNGPIALVQRDRSYRLALPPVDCHLLLFDVFTGVPLEWHRAGPQLDTDTVDFAGNAEPLELRLVPADPAARGALCTLTWFPDNQDWPGDVGSLPPRPGRFSGMLTDARAGDTVQFWAPARRGELSISSEQGRGLPGEVARIRLAATGTEPVAVPVPAPRSH